MCGGCEICYSLFPMTLMYCLSQFVWGRGGGGGGGNIAKKKVTNYRWIGIKFYGAVLGGTMKN